MDRGPIEKSRRPVISIVPIKNTVKVQFDPAKNWYIVGPKRLICLQLNDQNAMNPSKNDTNSFCQDDMHLNFSNFTHEHRS